MVFELPDGTPLDLPAGSSGRDIAAAIGPGRARAALGIKRDGETYDLGRPLPHGGRVEIVTATSGDDALELMRPDTAPVLAPAALDLSPGVKISIGPPIDAGFFYDFEFHEGTAFSDA